MDQVSEKVDSEIGSSWHAKKGHEQDTSIIGTCSITHT